MADFVALRKRKIKKGPAGAGPVKSQIQWLKKQSAT